MSKTIDNMSALPIPLIKCLYNQNIYCGPLLLSDECFNAYAERFGKESTYLDGKQFSIEPTFIEFVERLRYSICGYFT